MAKRTQARISVDALYVLIYEACGKEAPAVVEEVRHALWLRDRQVEELMACATRKLTAGARKGHRLPRRRTKEQPCRKEK